MRKLKITQSMFRTLEQVSDLGFDYASNPYYFDYHEVGKEFFIQIVLKNNEEGYYLDFYLYEKKVAQKISLQSVLQLYKFVDCPLSDFVSVAINCNSLPYYIREFLLPACEDFNVKQLLDLCV